MTHASRTKRTIRLRDASLVSEALEGYSQTVVKQNRRPFGSKVYVDRGTPASKIGICVLKWLADQSSAFAVVEAVVGDAAMLCIAW